MRARVPACGDVSAPAPLFRRQASEAVRPRAYGELVLHPGRSARWAAWGSLALVLALLALLFGASYTRRSTVSGQLLPSAGLIRIAAPQGGLVVERPVRNDQAVRRGDTLFVLSGERAGPGQGEVQRAVAERIGQRLASLRDEERRLDEAARREQAQLQLRQASLRDDAARVAQQLALQAGRVAAAQDAVGRYRGLFEQGYSSRDELAAREADLAEQRSRLEGLKRDALATQREAGGTAREADGLRSRGDSQRAELQRAQALLQQELIEAEARRRSVVSAPADGRLTLLRADLGQTVEPLATLAQLLPATAELQATLYAPSRAAGFTRPGAAVLLRYDAYPYQKFGQHLGRVLAVSAAAVPAHELPALGLQGGATPSPAEAAAPEPLFAITVALPAQALQAGDRALPLQAGMRVQAELLHETRRLYEWVLEPWYALRAGALPPPARP